eukprot:TRINITY_DN8391_c0_g1_i2.p1 TRINITY_DN8391_c0_g1~~TRINITY_DN8391_c0_g1_i2.p1  ORF type:complete len:2764 (+),score=775.42 TRINITY_DN8391_c0_g1_i2:2862-11153(+)
MPGYYGAGCDVLSPCLPAATESWDRLTGACVCRRWFDGNWCGHTCERCCDGYYGSSCSVQCDSEKCSGHGSCGADGDCVCSADPVNGFWGGAFCGECAGSAARGFWSLDSGCKACLPGWYPAGACNTFCSPPDTCSGHGSCSVHGSCECEGLWAGMWCDRCEDGWTGDACSVRLADECVVGAESAVLNAARTSLRVTFREALSAPTVGVYDCSAVLAVESALAVGQDSTCTFVDRGTLLVALSGDVSLTPGDVLRTASVLRRAGTTSCPLSSAHTRTIAPFRPDPPTVTVLGPASSDGCGSLTYNAFVVATTRVYTLTWALSGKVDAGAKAAAEREAGASLVLDSAWIQGQVTVSVTLADEYGSEVVATTQVSRVVGPRVQLDPVTPLALSADFTKEIVLRVRARLPCAADGQRTEVAYTWRSLTAPGLGLLPSGAALTLPGMALEGPAGVTSTPSLLPDPHLFECSVQGGSSVVFAVTPLVDLSCAVRGGNTTVPLSAQTQLRADVLDGMNLRVPESVRWSCRFESGLPCRGTITDRLLPSSAGADSGDVLVLWATVRKGLRECTTAPVQYTVSPAAAAVWSLPQVWIDGVEAGGRVQPLARTVLTAAGFEAALRGVDADVSFLWTSEGLNLSDTATAPLGAAGVSILLSESAILPGQSYVVSVTVRVSGVRNATSSASVSLRATVPPFGGTLEVQPPVVLAPATQVRATAAGWVSDSGGLLSFRLTVVDQLGAARELTDWGAATVVEFPLPPPTDGDAAPFTLLLEVRDEVTGAVTAFRTPIVVVAGDVPADGGLESQFASVQDSFADPIAENNAAVAVAEAAAVARVRCVVSPWLTSRVPMPTTTAERRQTPFVLQALVCPDAGATDAAAVRTQAELAAAVLVGSDGLGSFRGVTKDAADALAYSIGTLSETGRRAASSAHRAAALSSTQSALHKLTETLQFSMSAGLVDGESVGAGSSGGIQVVCSRTTVFAGAGAGPPFEGSASLGALSWNPVPVPTAGDPGAFVDFCAVQWTTNPLALQYPNTTDTFSHLHSYRAGTADGNILHPANGEYVFEMELAADPGAEELVCGWWDVSALVWSTEGCRSNRSSVDVLRCNCTHLTDFSAIKIPQPGALLERFMQMRFDPTEVHMHALVFLSVITAAALVSVVCAAHWSRRSHRRKLELTLDADEAAVFGIQREAYAGDIGPRTFRESVSRRLAQDPSVHAHYTEYNTQFVKAWVKTLSERVWAEHPWLRSFRADTGNFDAPRRLAVLWCLVATLFVINAALFRPLSERMDLGTRVLFFAATLLLSALMIRVVDPVASYLLIRSARHVPEPIKRRRGAVEAHIKEKAFEIFGHWWEELAGKDEGVAVGAVSGKEISCSPAEEAEAVLALYDADGDGTLSPSEFNALLTDLFPEDVLRCGPWTDAVLHSMLQELGSSRMDASALLHWYRMPHSPSFGQLHDHYTSRVLRVSWCEPLLGIEHTVRADRTGFVVYSGCGPDIAIVAVDAVGQQNAVKLWDEEGAGIVASLPFDPLIVRRLAAMCGAAGVRHTLSRLTVRHRPADSETTLSYPLPKTSVRSSPAGSPQRRQSPGPTPHAGPAASTATTPTGCGDVPRAVTASPARRSPSPEPASPPPLSAASLPPFSATSPVASPTLIDAASRPRAATRTPPTISSDSSEGGTESGLPAPALLTRSATRRGTGPRRVSFYQQREASSASSSEFVRQCREQEFEPERRQSESLMQAASTRSRTFRSSLSGDLARHRMDLRRSIGAARITFESAVFEADQLAAPRADPLAPWAVFDGVQEEDTFSLGDMAEILRGEAHAERALCAVAVACNLALRGGRVPSVVHTNDEEDAAAAGDALIIDRPSAEPLGLIVAGRDLTLRGVTPGSAAHLARVDEQFHGRKLISVNGGEASLTALRTADDVGGPVHVVFERQNIARGDVVCLVHGAARSGCLGRPNARGTVVRMRYDAQGDQRVLVRRTLAEQRWADWYSAGDLQVVKEGAELPDHANEADINAMAVALADVPLGEVVVGKRARPPTPPIVRIEELIEAMHANATSEHAAAEWFEEKLWRADCNRAAWRVGLELVLEHHFGLAAAVFEVVPLILNPDLVHVLHPVPVPPDGLPLAGVVGRAASCPRVGALWVQHYAALHLGPGPWQHCQWECPQLSSREAGPFVTAVLGLQDAYAPHASFGGASFHLSVESEVAYDAELFKQLVSDNRLLEAAHAARGLVRHPIRAAAALHRRAAGVSPPKLLSVREVTRLFTATGRKSEGPEDRSLPYSGFRRSRPKRRGCADRAVSSVLSLFLQPHRGTSHFGRTIEYGRLVSLFAAADAMRCAVTGPVLLMLRQEREAVAARAFFGLHFGGGAMEAPGYNNLRGFCPSVPSSIAAEDPLMDPASGTANNNCDAGDHFRPNPYLTAHLCCRFSPEGGVAADPSSRQLSTVRIVGPNYPQKVDSSHYKKDEVWGMLPYRQLGRFLCPGAGSGIAANPHFGIPAAVAAARIGDTLVLLPGVYPPCRLERVRGSLRLPVCIAGHGAAGIRATASEGVTSATAAAQLRHGTSALARRGCVADLLPQRRLPPDDQCAMIYSKGRNTVLLDLVCSSHVEVVNVRLRASGDANTVGVAVQTSTDTLVSDCSFLGLAKPFTLGRWTAAQENAMRQLNYFDRTEVRRSRLSRCSMAEFGSSFRYYGYAVAAAIYLLLTTLSLFLTAGFSGNEVLEWVARAAITFLFDVLLLQPAVIVFRSLLQRLRGDVDGGAEVGADTLADFTMG